MDLTERTVASETLFEGHIVRLKLDKAELLNGRIATREVVEHPGGVAVLAMDEDGLVTLVRQYRYPFHEVVTELPAGKLEYGEDPALAARRELEEEVGVQADELHYLGCLYSSPGFCNERLHMYLARGLHQGESHPDEGEFLERMELPFGALVEQIMTGEITDAKTVATVLKVKVLLGR
jgi:ADP-ribose pyrophosphatase